MGRFGIASIAGRLGGMPWLRRRLPEAALAPPERLRWLFEQLGGTFVKLGQMLSLQPDVLSPAHCRALFKLLDDVPAVPFPDIRRVLDDALGERVALLEDLDPRPLASASVGQVHRARIDGREWAVKVQRPTVETDFRNDLRLMTMMMWGIRAFRLRPLDWLLEPLGEFVAWTREELDYRCEARYGQALRDIGGDAPGRYVPRIDARFTTRRTMAIELLEGTSLVRYLRALETGDEVLMGRVARTGFDHETFAGRVIDNFLGDAFRHGIYHADLHPANLWILPDSTVGYIDFGITGVLSPYARRQLMRMTLAMARGDLEGLVATYAELAEPDDRADLDIFRRGLSSLAPGWYTERPGGPAKMTAGFTQVMTEMLQVSRASRVMPARDIVKYIRSAIAIDGLIARLVPGHDLAAHLAATCRRHEQALLRAAAIEPARLLEGSAAIAALARDGATRLERLVREPTTPRHQPPPRTGGRLGLRLAVATVVGVGLLAMSATPVAGAGDPTLSLAHGAVAAVGTVFAFWALRATGAAS